MFIHFSNPHIVMLPTSGTASQSPVTLLTLFLRWQWQTPRTLLFEEAGADCTIGQCSHTHLGTRTFRIPGKRITYIKISMRYSKSKYPAAKSASQQSVRSSRRNNKLHNGIGGHFRARWIFFSMSSASATYRKAKNVIAIVFAGEESTHFSSVSGG